MNDTLTVGSLFSGIGGFDLGFERAGMRTLWFCEQDAFCQRVLAKHWPGVPCHSDVRALVADAGEGGRGRGPDRDTRDGALGQEAERGEGIHQLAGGGDVRGGPMPVPVPYVDVLCGGFPCQDISLAGRGGGIQDGSRSGIWREFARLIGELRPRYVVVENVPAITSRGLDIVLADLAACGFDAEWDHLPASALGAPHRRDRFWLVAYPDGEGESAQPVDAGPGTGLVVGDPEGDGRGPRRAGRSYPAGARQRESVGALPPDDAYPDEQPQNGPAIARSQRGGGQPESGLGLLADGLSPWLDEPDIPRVAAGVPERVNQLRALGNSLVPQIAEWIGRRIVEWERG